VTFSRIGKAIGLKFGRVIPQVAIDKSCIFDLIFFLAGVTTSKKSKAVSF